MRWTKQRRKDLSDSIDDLFVFCGLSERDEHNSREFLDKGKVSPFSFVEPQAFIEASEGDLIGVASDEDAVCVFADVTPRDVPRWDSSCVKSFTNEDGKRSIELYRFKQAPLSAARGSRIYSPHVGYLYRCGVDPETGRYSGARWVVNKRGSQWVRLGSSTEYSHFVREKASDCNLLTIVDQAPDEINNTCKVLLGSAFNLDLVWRVVFRGPSGLSFSISTDSAGAMAAFRNREPNSSSGRRDSLRHWVRQHYRTSKKDSDDGASADVFVREHLRGRTPFMWHGIQCELVVAPFDVRRCERSAIERREMASA